MNVAAGGPWSAEDMFSRKRRIIVTLLCAIVALIDGLDTQSIGLVAPSIAQDFHAPAAAFGPIFGGGLLAGTVGAFLFGMIADRWGRKPVLIAATVLFALCSIGTIWTGTLGELLFARVATGFGLGGALPIIIAITSESAAPGARTRTVALMYCGFPLGSVLGGVASALLVPSYGWQSVFLVGGLLPLLLLPFLMIFLPSSTNHRRDRRATGLEPSTTPQRPPLALLFADGRTAPTLLIWTTLFLSLLLTVFMVNWIPLIVRSAGLSLQASVLAVSMLNIGGILGGILIGRLCDATRSTLPIALAYGIGAPAVAALGILSHSTPGLLSAALVAGFLTVGAQMSAIATSSRLYPDSVRSTGVGYAFGVGRIGAVVGPLLGGVLVGAALSPAILFLIAGGVAAAAALASGAIRPHMLDDGAPAR